METLAWLQANLLTAWAEKGKRVRPEQLYRKPGAAPSFESKEEYREYMRKKQQKIEDGE